MSPITRGTWFAVLSAVAFGVSVPLIHVFGADAGPWSTAALLYCGAAIAGVLGTRSAIREAPPRGKALLRIAVAGVLGAAFAPALLAWGLQHTSALAGSLALAFEAAGTVVLAAIFLREHVGARAILAVLAASLGAVLLALGGAGDANGALSAGTVAVLLATLLWAIDSTITGSVARFDPGTVTSWKCAIGTFLSFVVSLAVHDRVPGTAHAAGLLLTGAVGYGISLQWYLLAQRTFGAARTASIFSVAPFVGALVAIALGDRPTATIGLAAGVFALAVYLHATERHGHEHEHPAERHEHAHSHDDDHHDHTHPGIDPHVPHSHGHDHHGRAHAHSHGSDFHHSHDHE